MPPPPHTHTHTSERRQQCRTATSPVVAVDGVVQRRQQLLEVRLLLVAQRRVRQHLGYVAIGSDSAYGDMKWRGDIKVTWRHEVTRLGDMK